MFCVTEQVVYACSSAHHEDGCQPRGNAQMCYCNADLCNGQSMADPGSSRPCPICQWDLPPPQPPKNFAWADGYWALFTARKRGLCSRPVSVRLSVTSVDYIQTAEDIVQLLFRPCSIIILVLWPERRYQIPREPLQRGRKIQGVGKFCDFRLKSPSISETLRDKPIVAMER